MEKNELLWHKCRTSEAYFQAGERGEIKRAIEAASKPTTLCECDTPGFCSRHRCTKNREEWMRCKSDMSYFKSMELPYVDTGCAHRGLEVRRDQCGTCAKRVQVKVFSCAIHGECAIDKSPQGVKSCNGCQDRTPSLIVEIDRGCDLRGPLVRAENGVQIHACHAWGLCVVNGASPNGIHRCAGCYERVVPGSGVSPETSVQAAN